MENKQDTIDKRKFQKIWPCVIGYTINTACMLCGPILARRGKRVVRHFFKEAPRLTMPRLCKFLVSLVLLIFLIRRCIGHCAQEMCEKKSLNLATDTKRNSFFRGYVLETLSFSSWKDCYLFCMRNCQCLSFNFYESSNKTLNCELNEANTKIVPEALVKKEGVTYYEPVRTYPGLEVCMAMKIAKLTYRSFRHKVDFQESTSTAVLTKMLYLCEEVWFF